MKKQKLIDHFTVGITTDFVKLIGVEIETHFVDKHGQPVSTKCSQRIFKALTRNPTPNNKWTITATKNGLITELSHRNGHLRYELGRQNLEIDILSHADYLLAAIREIMGELYRAAERCGAYPLSSPIVDSPENVLIIPDQRDASWLALDGEEALNLLAKTASVQFTVGVKNHREGIKVLNKLADSYERLTENNTYEQDVLWKRYIKESKAGYHPDRYGILKPRNIYDYVDQLSRHDVVKNGKLYPFAEGEQDVDLFLRSVWWNFRLRRYGNRLCVEIRIFARRDDAQIERDLNNVLDIIPNRNSEELIAPISENKSPIHF